VSLELNNGTTPNNLHVFTPLAGKLVSTVMLGSYEISYSDFFLAAFYVLTNTDLQPNDHRLQFVKAVKAIEIVHGFDKDGQRLASQEWPASS